jgi:hypothetical protein
MRHAREKLRIPLATNTVVVNFEQLGGQRAEPRGGRHPPDTTFWGGIRACVKAAGVCETFQLGVAVHSSGELGIQLATMLHLGAVLPNLSYAADAHYITLSTTSSPAASCRTSMARSPCRKARPRRARWTAPRLAQYAALYKELGRIPTIRIPAVQAGRRSCPTIAGRGYPPTTAYPTCARRDVQLRDACHARSRAEPAERRRPRRRASRGSRGMRGLG